jgi:hypothetical protein
MYTVHEQTEAPSAIPLDCPSCGLPAQIVDRFTLSGSPGAVEHIKIRCGAGHWFTAPVDSLQGHGSSDRASIAGG